MCDLECEYKDRGGCQGPVEYRDEIVTDDDEWPLAPLCDKHSGDYYAELFAPVMKKEPPRCTSDYC